MICNKRVLTTAFEDLIEHVRSDFLKVLSLHRCP
jgi:hypothetical protein